MSPFAAKATGFYGASVTQQPQFRAMHLPCASARLVPVSLQVLEPANGHDTLNLYPTRFFQTRLTFSVTV